jgi:hypothetical protein
VDDEAMNAVAKLTNLTSLSVASCRALTNDSVAILHKMTNLKVLNLEYCLNMFARFRLVELRQPLGLTTLI